MTLPFTVEQFFEVFVRYNQGVWPMQVVLVALALAAVLLLFVPRPHGSQVISAIVSFLWAWMAIAYHFAFFAAINPGARFFGAFFLLGAFWFAWIGVIKDHLRFAAHGGLRAWLGGLLIAFALLGYPLLGALLGHWYPATPTFGLPCPTTIYTIGMLLFAVAPVPRSAFIAPVLWSMIGATAAFTLGVPQDYSLLAAGLIGAAAAIWPGAGRSRTLDNGGRGGR
jgi:hypothetical protein